MSKSMKSKPATTGKPVAIEVEEHELDAVHGSGGMGADRSSGGGAGKSSFSDISFTTSANKASPS